MIPMIADLHRRNVEILRPYRFQQKDPRLLRLDISVRLTSAVKQRGAFQPRCGRSGAPFAATNGPPAGASCKRRDAAPVLFD